MGRVSVLHGSRPFRRSRCTVKPVEVALIASLQRKTTNHPRREVDAESSEKNGASRAIMRGA